MKSCYQCKKKLMDTDICFNAFKIGHEGAAIPIGMKGKDVICHDCFQKEKSQYKVDQERIYVSPMVKQVEIHDKVLSEEEIRTMFKRGPPTIDGNTPHIISHRDEKDGYLWIDGKKVKRENLDETR